MRTRNRHSSYVSLCRGEVTSPLHNETFPVHRYLLSLALAGTLLALAAAQPGHNAHSQPVRQNGIAYTAWWSGEYTRPDAGQSLTRLAETGAGWISLLATGYQDTIDSTTIYTNSATPTDAELVHVIQQAHDLGLQVMLKPHVDLWADPNHWRGEIGTTFTTPAQWDAWFDAYESFIWHYAELAEAHDADQFAIGTELVGTSGRADDWRAVIAGVRSRYSGPIVYAANHSGEETSITWWDAVDLIGVDAYYGLTNLNDPTPAQLQAAWAPHVATLANLAATWNKPIIFTEIGYRSIDGANRHPWDWSIDGNLDLQEQADAYQATLASVYDQPWFAGMYWWAWETNPYQGGPCERGYTPYDKPAEDVLRSWYGAAPRSDPLPVVVDETQTLPIYTDSLAAGWQNWSWGASVDFAATGQVYSGSHAIAATFAPWGGLSLWHEPVVTTPYRWLEFYVRGAAPGGQHVGAFFHDAQDNELRAQPVDSCRYIEDGSIAADRWKRVRIPLMHLDAANRLISRVTLNERTGAANVSIRVDAIRLLAGQPCPDFDGSGAVDLLDLQSAAEHWHTSSGTPVWDGRFDLNESGHVDILDVQAVAAMWQATCPSSE